MFKKTIEDELSPFIYGKTVSSLSFTNREEELLKLVNNLKQGVNTMLISPRRWGKSSLVEKAILQLNKESARYKTVSIDLFSVPSQQYFLEIFAREVIKASSNKWEDWMQTAKNAFKQLNPKIQIGINPSIDFTITFDWQELNKYPDEVLDLPRVLGEQKNIRYVICLDEFQNLAQLDDYEIFEKQMRAIWQRQKNVTYCLYGSKRHMMTDIFNTPSKPFYRFGDIMLLSKIKEDKWITFIVSSFKKSGKEISRKNAAYLPQLMKNHSWYVQQLAHYTWQNTGKKASVFEINKALAEVIRANSPLYQREIELLTNAQVNLLKAISQKEKQLTAKATLDKYKLGSSAAVVKNKTMMLHQDLLNEEQGTYHFLDPVFELWFRKIYFGEDYLLLDNESKK